MKYHFEHKTIKPAKEFHLTDAEYGDFVKWLSNKEYDYTTQVERDLNDLEASAKKEKSIDVIQDQLKGLRSKLAHSKDNDLQISKTGDQNDSGRRNSETLLSGKRNARSFFQ